MMEHLDWIAELLAWVVSFLIVVGAAHSSFVSVQYDLDSGSRSDNRQADRHAPRFSPPLPPRFATSHELYMTWLVIYMLGPLTLFVLAAASWHSKSPDLAALDPSLGLWAVLFESYPPMLVALLIVYLERFNRLSFSPIAKWQDFCLKRARIPTNARTLYTKLLTDSIRYRKHLCDAAILRVNRLNADTEASQFPYLSEQDFLIQGGTLRANWARTCYLFYALETRGVYGYAEIKARPELKREQILRNLAVIAEDIRAYRENDAEKGLQSLETNLESLKRQVCQYVVCVLFAAYRSEDEVYAVVRDLGVTAARMPRYRFNFPALFWSMVGFGAFALAVSVGLEVSQSSGVLTREGTSVFTRSAEIAGKTLLVIFTPSLVVFILKGMLTASWPIRGAYSERQLGWPLLLGTVAGAITGGTGLTLIGLMGGLSAPDAWYAYAPFLLLSAAVGALTAFCVDFPARKFQTRPALFRAAAVGVVSFAAFAALGAFAYLLFCEMVERPKGEWGQAAFFLGAVGAVAGVLIAVSAERFSAIDRNVDELSLLIAGYLEPILPNDFAGMTRTELGYVVQGKLGRLPDGLVSHFMAQHVLDEKGMLTEGGYQKLTWRWRQAPPPGQPDRERPTKAAVLSAAPGSAT